MSPNINEATASREVLTFVESVWNSVVMLSKCGLDYFYRKMLVLAFSRDCPPRELMWALIGGFVSIALSILCIVRER